MDLSPSAILREVAQAVPAELRGNITIIGSLAAGYQLFPNDSPYQVRTKEVDCVLVPRSAAVHVGQSVAGRLLESGWTHKVTGDHAAPGTALTPTDALPAIRLEPPGAHSWFLELLTVPDRAHADTRSWTRVELSTGHFGLPAFRFLPVTVFDATTTEFGVACARAEMMALANLLEHPRIGPETMSGLIASRAIKRSNKDLGRAIAIARLDLERLETWSEAWFRALDHCFPEASDALCAQAGQGLRALLNSPSDLEEALITCNNGLLANQNVTAEEFRLSAERLLVYAIEPLEKRSGQPGR